tara:strand:- start:7882 stop:8601 length:720 start_codon:yes stop_codon:yes gene_type:complete
MRNLGRVVGHIPARAGSERVRCKNLRYIAGEPLLTYSIKAALESGVLDEVVVNTDGDDLAALSEECGAKVFRRDANLASATASGDAFTYDFITKYPVDTLVMISPVCPLVKASDILAALELFKASDADTLITCCETRMQTFKDGVPVNIDPDGPLAPTQDNVPVQTLNWAVTVWDCAAFQRHFDADGHAYLGRSRLLMPIAPLHGVKISTEADFQTAEALLRSGGQSAETEPRYWRASE